MHHPPVVTGVPAWDAVGLPASDRQALAEMIGRHRQVQCIVSGHVHHAVVCDFAGRLALSAPSTYVQTRLDFESPTIQLTAEPAGFAVHSFVNGALRSHIHSVRAQP
jgi:Icc protein